MSRKPKILFACLSGLIVALLILNWTDVLLLGGQKSRVIKSLAASLREFYVIEEDANAIAAHIEQSHADGNYLFALTTEMFWKEVQNDMRSVCEDDHLLFVSSPDMVTHAKNMIDNVDTDNASDQMKSEADNHGIAEARMIGEQTGYLNLTRFANPMYGRDTLLSALSQLEDATTVIIDLRENNGGFEEMVQILFSYFTPVEESFLIASNYVRYKDETEEFWTLADVPTRPLQPERIYILSSSYTFSAAESFAYSMKHHGRAMVIGERTRGGAHSVEWKVLEDHYVLRVSVGREVHPVTDSNWEGTGVIPNIQVPSNQALDEALRLAGQS